MFSVLLSLYCKESPDYLNQALISIYDSQILKPDQVVLVKDGPLTPALDEIIGQWGDKLNDVLDVVALESNVGLGAALNAGLRCCKHDLVARMDTDDIAMPSRFKVQVDAFTRDDDLDVLGAAALIFSNSLDETTFRKSPVTHSEIIDNIWANAFIHPTVMFKKSSICRIGGYNAGLRRRQDYELWFRCAQAGLKLGNLDQPLLYYRFSEETHKKQSIKSTWEQGVIGFKGSSALGLAYWKQFACFVPFLRSLFPLKVQHLIYNALSKFDPRRV